jgi:NAD(P)-dependent dehydrogenase (short-subunit alcohol dehydrogenase family)
MSAALIKRPLITGASRGIGRAFVDEFLAAGAEKIYAAVRSEKARAELASVDARIVPVIVDVTKPEQVQAAAAAAPDITVLVNNAGVETHSGLLSAPSMDNARHEMEVNYFGPLAMARAFVPALLRTRGAIVSILSIGALINIPAVGTYSASKAAARSMTQGLRTDLGPQGIRVIAAYPSGYDTDMSAYVTQKEALFPPRMLTGAVLAALTSGAPDEIFPDPFSQMVSTMVRDEPEKLVAMLSGAGA